MNANSPTAPRSVCILRLSALGDVSHVLPLIHRLQASWPDLSITWIIGQLEHKLVKDLPDVEFITYKKGSGFAGYRELRRQLAGRHFDALLQMQLSARANLLSTAVKAKRRIGFDRQRSKEGHGLFINERIQQAQGYHVVDALQEFATALGAPEQALDWTLPSRDEDRAWADKVIPGDAPFAIFSPASSHPLRNWTIEGYARLADHLQKQHGLRILLCGGPSPEEAELADHIDKAMDTPCLNLVGQDTLTQFLALLRRADLLVSPDSGPAHFAAITQTPVLALHAATDPQRSGPYHWRDYAVDQFAAAAEAFSEKPASELPWGSKIEVPGVMELISPEMAIAAADRLLESLR